MKTWNERRKELQKEWNDELSNHQPCKNCLVKTTCTKSFIDGSACDKLIEEVREDILWKLAKRGENYEEK